MIYKGLIVLAMACVMAAGGNALAAEPSKRPVDVRAAVQAGALERVGDDSRMAFKTVQALRVAREHKSFETPTDLDGIRVRMRRQLDWTAMTRTQQFLMDTLLQAVHFKLQRRVQEKRLDPDAEVSGGAVLKWSRQALCERFQYDFSCGS